MRKRAAWHIGCTRGEATEPGEAAMKNDLSSIESENLSTVTGGCHCCDQQQQARNTNNNVAPWQSWWNNMFGQSARNPWQSCSGNNNNRQAYAGWWPPFYR
jgi:hypothetical protein